jgi:hypothetical protein
MVFLFFLFVWAYLPNLSTIQQCFSLTTNQWIVLLAIAFQSSERSEIEKGNLESLLSSDC